MPSSEIMPLFRAGKLHSGSDDGEIVKNPEQAKAILLSYLRKEGKIGDKRNATGLGAISHLMLLHRAGVPQTENKP